jgi:ABC-type nitrate/sulfonate/bicarbonate transport system substrate-binding protein
MAEAQGLRKIHAAIPSISPSSVVFVNRLIKSDPILIEKLVRASLKALLYFRSDRSGAVSSLARFLKSKEDLAGRLYDLILPGTTRDGTINEELQKKSIEHVIERVGVKEPPPLDRMYNFSIARKGRNELLAKGWRPRKTAKWK